MASFLKSSQKDKPPEKIIRGMVGKKIARLLISEYMMFNTRIPSESKKFVVESLVEEGLMARSIFRKIFGQTSIKDKEALVAAFLNIEPLPEKRAAKRKAEVPA